MKKTIKIIACFLLLFGCSDKDNLLEDIVIRGGYVNFDKEPTTLNLNILKLDTEKVFERLIDYNENVTRYSLTLTYEDIVVNDFVVLTSFPADLEIPISDFISALGIAEEDITLSTTFDLVATITTPTGTYSGKSPSYNSNNVNDGGDTTDRLKGSAMFDAVEFAVSFFQPPAKMFRFTSFEEVPVGADTDQYDKPGSATESEDLVNGENPPFVDYTALGNSSTDEIGFDSEYIFIPDYVTSFLGFVRERIGVTSASDVNGGYPDGTKGFLVEDPDGTVKITFDTVTVPDGQTKSGVSFEAFFRSTTWENQDQFRAYANITTASGSSTVEIIDLFEGEINDYEGSWVTFNSGYLNNVISYQLVIELTNADDSEDMYIDNVIFYVPEED